MLIGSFYFFFFKTIKNKPSDLIEEINNYLEEGNFEKKKFRE